MGCTLFCVNLLILWFWFTSQMVLLSNINKRDHSFKYCAAYWEMSKVAVYKQSHMRHVNTWCKQGKRHLASL